MWPPGVVLLHSSFSRQSNCGYTGQLESILEYVSQLQQVDTEGVPETTRAVEVTNVTRADGVQPTPVREDILNQAPQREGDFFRVPKILAD